MQVEKTSGRVVIANELIQLCATVEHGQLHLTLSASEVGAGFVPVLERIGQNVAEGRVRAECPESPTLEVEDCLSDGAILVVRGRVGDLDLALSLRMREHSTWLEVGEVLTLDREASEAAVDWMEAVWRFVDWQASGEIFSPVLVPEPGDVVGRHVMRSPALTAQSNGRAAALVYDTDSVGRKQALPACMNLLREDDGTPILRTGLRPHRVRGHVYYAYAPDSVAAVSAHVTRACPLHHTYYLHVAADAQAGEALDAANRFLWSRFGTRSFRAMPSAAATPEDYARQIYPRAFDLLWDETLRGGRRVGAIRSSRSYPNDVWFCQWFNQLRSAYGLYVWGRETSNREWLQRALATRDLVLDAPQDRGMFPTVFVFGESPETCRWVHSHHQGGGPGIYHLLDMSWTVYQLLRWHRDLKKDARSLAFARAYGLGLVALQLEDGSLPAYLDAGRFTPVDHIDRNRLIVDLDTRGVGDPYVRHGVASMWPEGRFMRSAEDAGSLLALAELVGQLPEDDPERNVLLDAALRLAESLEAWVYPENRWIDFEVYYSCSPKPLGFCDTRSGQWPENTLCMHTAAAGFLALYRTTQESHHLDLARRAMNRLSLYQQIWDPPFLGFYGFGGYGVMNTDGEWNDARQAQFADTHLDFYRVLDDEEHLERALAAYRAGFVTTFLALSSRDYPTGWQRFPQGLAAENHAHGGTDGLCGVSGFDWGAGSALSTAAYFRLHGVA